MRGVPESWRERWERRAKRTDVLASTIKFLRTDDFELDRRVLARSRCRSSPPPHRPRRTPPRPSPIATGSPPPSTAGACAARNSRARRATRAWRRTGTVGAASPRRWPAGRSRARRPPCGAETRTRPAGRWPHTAARPARRATRGARLRAQCACELLLLRRRWAAEATRDALSLWRIRIGADDPRTSRALAWAAARRRLRRCGAALRRWATEVRWRAMLRDISTRCATARAPSANFGGCAAPSARWRRTPRGGSAWRRRRCAPTSRRSRRRCSRGGGAARASWPRARGGGAPPPRCARARHEVGARLRQLGALRAAGEAQRRDSDARWRAAYSAFAGERSPARSPALRTPTCRS